MSKTDQIETYNKLKKLVESMDEDIKRFHTGGVKVCAKRYRSKLLECKKLCGEIRKHIQADVKAMGIKPKASKPMPIPKAAEP